MPNFILATFLVIIFSVQLGWSDVIGWEFMNPRSMTLPRTVALGMLPAAYIARITRASMLEVLNQDYIRTGGQRGSQSASVDPQAHDSKTPWYRYSRYSAQFWPCS